MASSLLVAHDVGLIEDSSSAVEGSRSLLSTSISDAASPSRHRVVSQYTVCSLRTIAVRNAST